MANPKVTSPARFAVSAMLIKHTPTGFNYPLMLDVIEAPDRDVARERFGMRAKDSWPEHGLYDVLAVEVADHA
jgi:hypothetical protein